MALLVIASVNVLLVDRMVSKSDRVADTVNVAGKLRMLGQRIALQAVSSVQGVGAGELEVRHLINDFETVLSVLSNGGYAFGMYVEGLSSLHRPRIDAVHDQWLVYRKAVLDLLEALHPRQTENESTRVAAQDAEVELMVEGIVGHSARILERTEALMSGILTDVQAVQHHAMRGMYMLLAIDALLLLLAFVAVRRQIVVPLRELSTHCAELARGNYSTRFQVSTNDEIGVLAHAFNDSAGRIGALIERIEKDRYDLEQAEAMFRGIAENSMVGVYIAHKGRFRYVNGKMAEMFGYSRDEMIENVPATRVFPDPPPDQPVTDDHARQRLIGDVPGLWLERKGQRKDGSPIEVEVFGSLMHLGQDLVTIGIALDITRRKEVEAQAQLAVLVHRHSSDAMVVTDPGGRVISVNPAFTKITGYPADEVIGQRLSILSSGRHDASFYRDMWSALEVSGSWEGDIWNRRKNGEIYAERLTINTIFDDDGTPRYRIGLFADITQKKQADDYIWRQANYDALTGLPNRQLFHARLEQAMKHADSRGLPVALVYLDLDDFKDLNDTLGHATGDKVLAQVAQRLQSCVGEHDTVARLGGDEFVLILGDVADPAHVDRICELVMGRLAEPYVLGCERAAISASMGITFYPDDGDSIKTLLQNADMAMYAAKGRGKHQSARFQPSMQAHMAARRELARDLQQALQHEQFHLVFQPIVEVATGRISKVECLLRWQHPRRGPLGPGAFIPFAEDSGAINEIGEWVFHEAAKHIGHWRGLDPSLQASINVSPVQFAGRVMSPEGWIDHLESLGLSGSSVVVEITERLLMEADAHVFHKLIAFRDAGVQVALDDFGTGYSAMSYLKRFDIDYIKIDQSFIRNLAPGSEDMVLCEAMIVMAHRLGLQVVAEGVETHAQWELLRTAGCDYAQGYLFSPPVEAGAFEALLREGHIAPPTSTRPQSSSTGMLPQRT